MKKLSMNTTDDPTVCSVYLFYEILYGLGNLQDSFWAKFVGKQFHRDVTFLENSINFGTLLRFDS